MTGITDQSDNVAGIYSNKHPESNFRTIGKLEDSQEVLTFSEALEKTKFGLFNYLLIIVSGVILSNVLLETTGVAYYMPVAHCDLDLNNSRKGLLSAVGYVGITISSHLWGFLADTQGRRLVMRPTLLLAFLVTLISSFSTNFWAMLILRLINGIFVSGASATVYAYLGEFHTDRTRSRAIMISAFIYGCGALFMPVVGLLVINQEWSFPLPFLGITFKPWRLFTIICGLPGFLAGLSLYYLPESPKFLLTIRKEDEAIAVLQKMYTINGGKDKLKIIRIIPEEDTNDITTIKNNNMNFFFKLLLTMWNQTVPLFRRKYLRSTLIVCTTQFFLHVITNGLFMWYPYIINAMSEFMRNSPEKNEQLCQIIYVKDAHRTKGVLDCPDKLENATYMYSLFMELFYICLFALLGAIINRIRKTLILFSCILVFSTCGLLAVLLPYTWAAAIFYCLFFMLGVCINVLGAATVDLYPTQLRGMAICVSLMMGRIGGIVATNIIGAVLVTFCEMTFYASCLSIISCALLILFLPQHISKLHDSKSTNL